MTARRPRRGTVLAGLVLSLLGWQAGTAFAGPGGATATLSGTTEKSGTLSTTLTVRSGSDVLAVDPASLSMTVGGNQVTPKVAPPAGRATMLVIDTSGSLDDADLKAIRSSVATFLATVPSDVKVGVASFASTAGVDLAPTADRKAVQAQVDSYTAEGNTALYAGVVKAVSAMKGYEEKSVILFTDGQDTWSQYSKITQAGALGAIRSNAVRVESVGLQTKSLDTTTLQAFAVAGGGSVTTAGDATALKGAFASAAKSFSSQIRLSVPMPAGLTGTQPVTVKGTASGQPFTVAETFVVGTLPAPTVAPTTAAQASVNDALKSGANVIIAVSVGALALGLLLLGLVFAAPALKSERQTRVEAIELYGLSGSTAKMKRAAAAARPSGISDQLVGMGEKVMSNRESTTKTMFLLEQADLPWRAGEWFVLRAVAAVVAVALGMLFFGHGTFWSQAFGLGVGLLVGLVLPGLVLRFLAKRRSNKFEDVLPDVLTLVATSLSSGFSLQQALDAVTRDSPEPARKEFSRALAEARIGADIDVALDHMSVRMNSESMRWATMAIKIQREVGGNLAETLKTTTKTLRERSQLKRHVRALSAEGRLSAYILIALPIFVFFWSMRANYDYISLLWTTVLGLILSGVGIVSMIFGIFWMRSVVKIEV